MKLSHIYTSNENSWFFYVIIFSAIFLSQKIWQKMWRITTTIGIWILLFRYLCCGFFLVLHFFFSACNYLDTSYLDMKSIMQWCYCADPKPSKILENVYNYATYHLLNFLNISLVKYRTQKIWRVFNRFFVNLCLLVCLIKTKVSELLYRCIL